MSFLYVFLGLLVLYLTYRKMTAELSRLIHRLGGSQNVLIWIWSVIFLPGTIIHEVSHFLAASATGTRTGKVEIFPEFIEDILEEEQGGKRVALGYVQTARMNPLQGFLVGIAPLISGLALLVWLAGLMQTSYSASNSLQLALQGYLFFVISNSFFPSWPDISQTLPLIIFTMILALLAWFFGFQLMLGTSSFIWNLLDFLSRALLLSITINLLFIGILFLINKKLR